MSDENLNMETQKNSGVIQSQPQNDGEKEREIKEDATNGSKRIVLHELRIKPEYKQTTQNFLQLTPIIKLMLKEKPYALVENTTFWSAFFTSNDKRDACVFNNAKPKGSNMMFSSEAYPPAKEIAPHFIPSPKIHSTRLRLKNINLTWPREFIDHELQRFPYYIKGSVFLETYTSDRSILNGHASFYVTGTRVGLPTRFFRIEEQDFMLENPNRKGPIIDELPSQTANTNKPQPQPPVTVAATHITQPIIANEKQDPHGDKNSRPLQPKTATPPPSHKDKKARKFSQRTPEQDQVGNKEKMHEDSSPDASSNSDGDDMEFDCNDNTSNSENEDYSEIERRQSSILGQDLWSTVTKRQTSKTKDKQIKHQQQHQQQQQIRLNTKPNSKGNPDSNSSRGRGRGRGRDSTQSKLSFLATSTWSK